MSDTTYHTQKRHTALGAEVRRGTRRINVDFDDEMFAQIRERAERERTSFAEQVRLLCEWGLQDAEEDERNER
jgi:hypothetical protein